jgi:cell division protein FtsZ
MNIEKIFIRLRPNWRQGGKTMAGDRTSGPVATHLPGRVNLKVIGVGGGGCNAVTRMVHGEISGVEFIAMNTDVHHLSTTEAPVRIPLGEKLTRGLGAGGDPSIGRRCAEESLDEIKRALKGADMAFIAAGMGGGTGTGAVPLVAKAAKDAGALTVAIVTRPFEFEGNHRMTVADEGIEQLAGNVDTLIVVPNDRLIKMADTKTSVNDAFKFADDVLYQAVRAVVELITVPGLINLDFAGIRNVLKNSGAAMISIGHGTGTNRAVDAAKDALAHSLADNNIDGAKRVLFGVKGGPGMSLIEIRNAASIIKDAVDPGANIIFGVNIDPGMGDDARLILIATDLAAKERPASSGVFRRVNVKGPA